MNTPDLDTFLVALYTIADDLYKAIGLHPNPHPGSKETMADSEILVLAICLQWMNLPERKLIYYVKTHWHSYFPRLITQSQFNRRFHALGKVMAYLVTTASIQMRSYLKTNNYEVLDTIGVPLMKRCRGKYNRLFSPEIANFGIGGSDKEWYYGVKLALAISPDGTATGFVLSPANNSDRWLAEYLLCYRTNKLGQPARVEDLPLSHKKGNKRTGPTGFIWPWQGVGNPSLGPYLADLGFNGKWWVNHWQTDYRAIVLVPDEYQGENAAHLRHEHYSLRQRIEIVNGHLSEELHLSHIGARGAKGLLARIAAKLLALNLGISLNKLFGRPYLALATLFSC